MAKNTNRVASAFAYLAILGLATGVSAAHWEVTADPAFGIQYATEIFGAGAGSLEIEAPDGSPTTVVATLYLDHGRNVGGAIDVTYTVHGANFGDTVRLGAFSAMRQNSTDDLAGLTPSAKRGGSSGDSSVTIKFTSGDAGFNSQALDPGDDTFTIATDGLVTLRFELPALEGAERLATPTGGKAKGRPVVVAVGVELVQVPTGNTVEDNFPEDVGVEDKPDTEVDESKPTFAIVATSKKAFTFTRSHGGGGEIDLDDRTSLLRADSISLGGLSLDVIDAKEKDGTKAFGVEDQGAGQINITVKGDLRDGDAVFFDQDGDGEMGSKEALDIDDGGATGDFRLANAFLDDEAAVDAARFVHYVPNGDDSLRRGVFDTEFAIEFDEASNQDPGSLEATAMLNYADVDVHAKAYAIPNPGMGDIGNVRIKCETSKACTVFLDCDGQDGMNYFGELGEPVAGGATMVLQAEDIADVLGADDGWMGRLSCEILSAGTASAQVLVRSGGSLINNTYVDDADLSNMVDRLAADVAAVSDAVDGVSDAVGGVDDAVGGVLNAVCTDSDNAGSDDCPDAG